ncbi:MAG TPA: membrane dipeptidase [Candidatus Kapabacteria bacterium]|nr:membrane dipeptidase [Candidatus Kapabacteria bacterium]HOQ49652.1 membrane dipeptidase [Candidatus Kapabacteria bacterium]HPP39672.1 membrane dipeptidase [Candidatus Kapabacteria bacterium]HPU23857.1 membrane dipeptidase [Candidatus Kapabacteria bacterium]
MKISDAHCDTLTAFRNNIFFSENAHWNLLKFQSVGGSLQYFALFTEPELAGDTALSFAVNCLGRLRKQLPDAVQLLTKSSDYDDSKVNILLSIEGAAPIINDINNLYAFYSLGVRAMTLTWNHRNFLADGIDEPFGLTSFGKEVILEMEKLKMIVDVSHLNVAGFDDVVSTISSPFIASHSNARSVFDHPRNLYDEQIQEIIRRNGFIGINLYSNFLGNEQDNLKNKMIEHIEHILKLGGENVLGFGADFDGITHCPFTGVESYPEIYNMLKIALSDDDLVDKIMFRNLKDFTLNYIQ